MTATALNLNLDPNTQGSGRADVYKAFVELAPTPEPPPPEPPPVPPPPPEPPPGRDGCLKTLKAMVSLLTKR